MSANTSWGAIQLLAALRDAKIEAVYFDEVYYERQPSLIFESPDRVLRQNWVGIRVIAIE